MMGYHYYDYDYDYDYDGIFCQKCVIRWERKNTFGGKFCFSEANVVWKEDGGGGMWFQLEALRKYQHRHQGGGCEI